MPAKSDTDTDATPTPTVVPPARPLVQSKVGWGTLTIGTDMNASGQVRACTCTPTNTYGTPVRTLSGEETDATLEVTWALVGKIVSDFTDPAGLVEYSLDHVDEMVAFEFVPVTPASATSPTITGEIRMAPLVLGGNVNELLEIDFEWKMGGPPVRTWAPWLALMAGDGMTVKVTGQKELDRAVDGIAAHLDQMKDVHLAVGIMVRNRAAMIAPKRSGDLAASLRADATGRSATVSTDLIYGPPIHWGWPGHNITGQPFITQAAQELEPQWVQMYADAYQRLVDREVSQSGADNPHSTTTIHR